MADDSPLQNAMDDQSGDLPMGPGGISPQNSSLYSDALATLSKGVDLHGKVIDNQTKDIQNQGYWKRVASKENLTRALGDFLYSFGQGMQASAQYPGKRGSAAGFGAALTGPAQMQQMRAQQQAMQMQRQAEMINARAAQQRATPIPVRQPDGTPVMQDDGTPLMLPPNDATAFSRELLRQKGQDSRAALRNAAEAISNQIKAAGQEIKVVANDNDTTSVVPLTYDELTPQQKARRDQTEAQTKLRNAQANYRIINGTLWDVSDQNSPKQVGDTRPAIKVTPEMAQKYGLPDTVVGQQLPVGAISSLAQAGTKPYHFYTTGDGVYVRNLITGESEKLGPPPVNAQGTTVGTITDPVSQQPMSAIIDKRSGVATPVQTAGGTPAIKLSDTEVRQRDQARQVQGTVDKLNKIIAQHPEWVGPWMGRVYNGEKTAGIIPEGANDLATTLVTLASQQPVIHGFRGGTQVVNTFEKAIGGLGQTPESIKGALKSIGDLANNIRNGNAAAEQRMLPPKKGTPIPDTAIKQYLSISGGDINKAKRLALSDGWKVE